MKLKPVRTDKKVRLTDADARLGADAPASAALRAKIAHQAERIGNLQRVFFADGRHALLIVLQGRDASGKDGTIRHVFSAVDPQGCEVSSFKVPTDLERSHDYLWRVHLRVPPRGMIGIFNRSHYEDVLVPRVRKWIGKDVCEKRYDQINAFEKMLSENGVTILKFFLHVSHDEQKRRLKERLTDEKKNWKFRAGDLEDRKKWPSYTDAYRDVFRHCSTKWAPWYIVPADDNHVRNWLIARVIADAMAGMHLQFPAADPSVLALKIT